MQNGLPFEKLFQTLSPDGRNALFDATKFGWIGSITQTMFVTVTWHSAPVKTLKDATTQEAILGASATSSDSYVLAMLTNRLLDTKFKVVHGYPGAAEVDLAVENGEVQGEAGKDWTTLTSTRPQWIKDGKINILVQMGMTPHADLKDVPMAIDLAKTAEDRHVMEVVFAKFGMSRPFFAPPGVSQERLAVLRRAFDATMRDDAFLADAQTARHGDQSGPWRGCPGAGHSDHENAGGAGAAGPRRRCGRNKHDGRTTMSKKHDRYVGIAPRVSEGRRRPCRSRSLARHSIGARRAGDRS